MPHTSMRPSLERAPGRADNWVERVGGLPDYFDSRARALHQDEGFTIERAIATAVSVSKKECAGVIHVHPDTKAKACAAVAEWEAKRKRASVSLGRILSDQDMIDLAGSNPFAAMDKSKAPEPDSMDVAALKAAIAKLEKLPVLLPNMKARLAQLKKALASKTSTTVVDNSRTIDLTVRHVRTEAGSRFYGQPIGSVITKDVIQRISSKLQRIANPHAASTFPEGMHADEKVVPQRLKRDRTGPSDTARVSNPTAADRVAKNDVMGAITNAPASEDEGRQQAARESLSEQQIRKIQQDRKQAFLNAPTKAQERDAPETNFQRGLREAAAQKIDPNESNFQRGLREQREREAQNTQSHAPSGTPAPAPAGRPTIPAANFRFGSKPASAGSDAPPQRPATQVIGKEHFTSKNHNPGESTTAAYAALKSKDYATAIRHMQELANNAKTDKAKRYWLEQIQHARKKQAK